VDAVENALREQRHNGRSRRCGGHTTAAPAPQSVEECQRSVRSE
jgi:hypothetical protein